MFLTRGLAADVLRLALAEHELITAEVVLDELERQGKGTGLVTMCIGGGMGIATVLERV